MPRESLDPSRFMIDRPHSAARLIVASDLAGAPHSGQVAAETVTPSRYEAACAGLPDGWPDV